MNSDNTDYNMIDSPNFEETNFEDNNEVSETDIAIIAMNGRFPQAPNLESFWQNLRAGKEGVTFFEDDVLIGAGICHDLLKQPNYVKAKPILANIDQFDAHFFGFSPREAEILDPQQRLFLECAWEVLELAGYDTAQFEGKISLYAGMGISHYYLDHLLKNYALLSTIGRYELLLANDKDYLATRVAYKLNLNGAAVTVQTACSTSLVATHLACQSLLNGECDLAMAGGVFFNIPQIAGYLYQEGMIRSPDGHCRAFDAKAQGTVFGSGVGILLLKRAVDAIAEGDTIDAIIKGSATNNDGSLKIGYTAPSVDGQAAVIAEAQAMAGVEAETITYIEAHGTGTPLGDPIEVAALNQVFSQSTDKKGFCAIGSVKTNVGHLADAAGVVGVIKTVLALKHQELPPSLHFKAPNPKIEFADSPFYVNHQLKPWSRNGAPRRAGVSAFGIGGTNAHLILEEVPSPTPQIYQSQQTNTRPYQLLVLSAKTSHALSVASQNLNQHWQQYPQLNLADAAYTLSVGRRAFSHRCIAVYPTPNKTTPPSSQTEFRYSPTCQATNPGVVFMFPGQGAQYVNMAQGLYDHEPVFRQWIDHCGKILQPHLGLDLRSLLYPNPDQAVLVGEKLNQTAIAQPAVFTIAYALAKLWQSWGIIPQAMIGHSVGEYVAACWSGVFSLEDALSLLAMRGQLIQQLPPGAMLSVPLRAEQLYELLPPSISVASINEPSRCVVSGPITAIETLKQQLQSQQIESRSLHVSHAFHSEMVEPILETFCNQVKKHSLDKPKIPYISNLSGTWITVEQATNPDYWTQHLRHSVQFAQGLDVLLGKTDFCFLEVGPGSTLSTFAQRHPARSQQPVLSSTRHPKAKTHDTEHLLYALGQLWLAGVPVDWTGFYRSECRRRIPLPTYPFERQKYWIEPDATTSTNTVLNLKQDNTIAHSDSKPILSGTTIESSQPTQHSRPTLNTPYVVPSTETEKTLVKLWEQVLGIDNVGIEDRFLELGGDSLIALRLLANIQKQFKTSAAEVMFQNPTIAEVAQSLDSTAKPIPASLNQPHPQDCQLPLVAIQPQGDHLPFFCTHPVGGSILCYQGLAKGLGLEQPFYGLQDSKPDNQANTLDGVPAMATRYIQALRSQLPQTAYQLGGWSLGGIIAFEMSRQLIALGETVKCTIMIDSYLPAGTNTTRSIADEVSLFVRSLVYSFGNPTDSCDQNFETLNQGLEDLEAHDQLSQALHLAHSQKLLPPEINVDQIYPLFQRFQVNRQAELNYCAKPYSNHVILLNAEQSFTDVSDSREGWAKLAQGATIHTLAGDHFSILQNPKLIEYIQYFLGSAE
ncbi:MAG: acyltransferase domain-containing protein [Symploca sp. SIO3E6]|nr:acyltransferase domain-containing protein [Caldora sp. SIO3E6]